MVYYSGILESHFELLLCHMPSSMMFPNPALHGGFTIQCQCLGYAVELGLFCFGGLQGNRH